MTLRVRLLGRPAIEADDEQPRPQLRGRKSWAVFARVALADRAVPRAVLAHELFGDADDPAAALRWSLADLRRAFGRPELLRGDPLTLPRQAVQLDVWLLAAGELPPAESGGQLLQGVDLRDSPGFDSWLMLARAQCESQLRNRSRAAALALLAAGDPAAAARVAEAAVRLDPLDEAAQELLLHALLADGQNQLAADHLAACETLFEREGLRISPALRAAAEDRTVPAPGGVRAGVVAASLLRAGQAALDAGAADGGVETLRRAAQDAQRADDPALLAEVLRALGSALVHAVRGFDGEGAVVLHRALRAARTAGRADLAADVLRELAFVDVQAGRHGPAADALAEAVRELRGADEAGLMAGILALRGMNEADQGRHRSAAALLERSAVLAGAADRENQRTWSLGVLSRSLLLAGRTAEAAAAAEASVQGAQRRRWHAFLPWPQAIRAECFGRQGEWERARAEAEQAFALGCELGDPCWEGLAARALSITADGAGAADTAWAWITDARLRCDRVPDRYVWLSGYIAITQLELAGRSDPALLAPLADRAYRDSLRHDLPEFQAWSLLYQAQAGRPSSLAPALALARTIDNPALATRLARMSGPDPGAK